ncbi:MAG: cupin domain-containing protein [Planctomycetes bacterium]|nr:cupin domain-containing protein [Planctomycetota bacterium]
MKEPHSGTTGRRPSIRNVLQPLAERPLAELFEPLLAGARFRLERIVSTGQATPPGEWYDQPTPEWVLLLSGAARLQFEGEPVEFELRPGDALVIPARCRHRVEWTPLDEETVWLALQFEAEESAACEEQ